MKRFPGLLVLLLVSYALGAKAQSPAAITGQFLERSGEDLYMELTLPAAALIQVGDSLKLEKYTETELFGAQVTAWVSVAKVEVLAVGHRMKLRIREETLTGTVNGKPIDPFQKPFQARLSTLPPAGEEADD